MAKQGVTKIDIKQVLAQKAPKASRKIPGFIVDYLIRTVHQEELNDILTRYHDKEGVDFMRELIGYFEMCIRDRCKGAILKIRRPSPYFFFVYLK